jgi:autotransporter-associated beta strand protein
LCFSELTISRRAATHSIRPFPGVIQDGGSLTKVGRGTLILTNANTYAGGTTIENGTLVVNNHSGSATGTGAVQVNAGVLGGRGTIAGAVTVGTGSGRRAMLDPGKPGSDPGHFLSILGALILNSDGAYNVRLKTRNQTVDQVMANGITINGAQFHFTVHGQHVLSPGTVFTVLENTAATPIAGAFSNLPDGSMFTVGPNTFQASYEGGDGNDLTLTVVP